MDEKKDKARRSREWREATEGIPESSRPLCSMDGCENFADLEPGQHVGHCWPHEMLPPQLLHAALVLRDVLHAATVPSVSDLTEGARIALLVEGIARFLELLTEMESTRARHPHSPTLGLKPRDS